LHGDDVRHPATDQLGLGSGGVSDRRGEELVDGVGIEWDGSHVDQTPMSARAIAS
jgi:hypothetical protein